MATQTEYGLGFSPLSYKNIQTYAFNEEMASQKDVGVFGIVEKDGSNKYFVSAEYLARQKAQLESFTDLLIKTNNLGKIYRLKVDDNPGRAYKATTSNLLTGSTIVLNTTGANLINALRFNFDMLVSTKADCGLMHFNDATVSMEYTLKVDGVTNTFSISDSLLGINKNKYTVDYSSYTDKTTTSAITLTFTSLVITLGTTFDANYDRLGLYDILIAAL